MVGLGKALFESWTGPHRYASIVPRLAAASIDVLPFLPLLRVGFYYQDEWIGSPWRWIWPAMMITVSTAYFIYFHTRYGATPGKALLRCRLVSEKDEAPIALRQAVVRELPWIVVFALSVIPFGGFHKANLYADSLWLGVCFVFIIYDLKNRSLDDIWAGVVLVRQVKNRQPEPTVASTAYPLPPHFKEAAGHQRATAALINLFGASGMVFLSEVIFSAGDVTDGKHGASLWLTKAVLLVLFWLICGSVRSSLGAAALGLRFHDSNGRPLSRKRCLLRSVPFLVIFLIINRGESGGFDGLLSAVFFALLLLMLSNAIALVATTRSLIDRSLHVRVYASRQPKLRAPVYTPADR